MQTARLYSKKSAYNKQNKTDAKFDSHDMIHSTKVIWESTNWYVSNNETNLKLIMTNDWTVAKPNDP